MKLRHNSKQVSTGMRGSFADSNGPTLSLPITKELLLHKVLPFK